MQEIIEDTEINDIEYMKDWKDFKLGDLIEVQSGYAFKSKDFEEDGEIPVIKIKNIVPPYVKINKDDTQYVSKEFLKTKPQFLINYKDILISLTGSNVNQIESAVGKVGRNRIKNQDMFLNQRVGKIVLKDKESANYDYIYYFLSRSETRYDLASSASGSANQANISPDNIKSLEITLPPLPTQQKIAQILSSLDDKIELNNAINKNLEEIAQTLFKQWFVDFEFLNENGEPYKSSGGEMVESELGEIPKGWKIEELCKSGQVVTGKTPPTTNKEFFNGSVPFIKTPDMHGNTYIIKTEDSLSLLGEEYQKNKTVNENVVLMSCIGAKAGAISITTEKSQFNQQINAFIPKNFNFTYYFYFYLNMEKENLRQKGSSGSTMININKSTFEKHKYLIPTLEVLDKFHNLIQMNFEEIKNNFKETQTLTKLRDELLPKLMSGEVRV